MKVTVLRKRGSPIHVRTVRVVPYGAIIQILVDTNYKYADVDQMGGDDEINVFFRESAKMGDAIKYTMVTLVGETDKERELLKHGLLLAHHKYGCTGYLFSRPSQRQFMRGEYHSWPTPRKKKPVRYAINRNPKKRRKC